MINEDEKNRILKKIGESEYRKIRVDMGPKSTDKDKLVIQEMIDLGLLKKEKDYGNNSGIVFEPAGARAYANLGL